MIKIKRAYEAPEKGDGFRILVDRLQEPVEGASGCKFRWHPSDCVRFRKKSST